MIYLDFVINNVNINGNTYRSMEVHKFVIPSVARTVRAYAHCGFLINHDLVRTRIG